MIFEIFCENKNRKLIYQNTPNLFYLYFERILNLFRLKIFPESFDKEERMRFFSDFLSV